jgi:gliding motility-associatede transport system auxiliary component
MVGIAALLGGLGVVAISFGLLLAVMALFQPFMEAYWIIGNLVVGVALLAASVFMSFDSISERLRSGEGRRAGKYGSSAVVSAMLGILILGFLAFLSERYSHRFDLSEAGVHTLSQQSKDLLESLEESVVITAFFAETEAPPIRDLLDRYAFESDRVELRFIDPNSAPVLVDELGLTTDELSRGIVRFEIESGGATNLSEFSESEITNALLKLVRATGSKIYFVTGHNERNIEPDTEGEDSPFALRPDSYGNAAASLVNETYEVAPLLLASVGDVPEDASAVIVAGPTRPFLSTEIAALERYVEGGGAVFIALDPRARTNLFDLLERWGVTLGDDVIVDQALAVFGQATTPIANEYDGTHPITSLLREPSLFPMVRSIELDPEVADSYSVLARTGPESWAERDLDAWRATGRAEYGEADLLGPVAVAVAGSPRVVQVAETGVSDEGEDTAGEPTSAAGRIVVFGDSDFATNEYLDALRNRDLFVNSINWLAGDVEQITVRPNVSRASAFQMSQEEFRQIQYLSLFLLPEAIAIFGVVMWWLRRRAR